MIRVLLILWLALCAGIASAQTEDDADFLTRIIQDSLSDLGRDVRLVNFEGALSSEATADAITVADDQGVWLRIEDLTLTWDRAALLSGRVEVDQLIADRIVLSRMPTAPDGIDLPTAEATPFALPELPVSVNIGTVRAREIDLAEVFLGEPVTARFEGAIQLEDGEGTADILLDRVDDKRGLFDVDASYSNDTRQLRLSLLAEEGPDGIAARLLSLPDSPALSLSIEADAPLDDFEATIALATSGEDRITGTVSATTTPEAGSRFAMNLAGDIRPLLAEQFDQFFGAQAVLRLEGTRAPSGEIDLSQLIIASEQVTLRGTAALDAQYWPTGFDLRGRLASGTGNPVRLPVAGDPTTVRDMALTLRYDSTESDAWTGRFAITDLARPDLTIDTLTLDGGGTIRAGAGDARGFFSADLDYNATGLAPADPALAQALGPNISGDLIFARLEEEPFVINTLTLSGAGIEAVASAIVKGPEDRFWTRAEITAQASDFSRFSGLAGVDIGGAGEIDLAGDLQPFDGIFDLDLAANTTDLETGVAQADALLRGQTTLSLTAQRDTEALQISRLQLDGEAISATGSARLASGEATGSVEAAITDIGLALPQLSGAATLAADIGTRQDGTIALETTLTAPSARLIANALATPQEEGYLLTGTTGLNATDLAPYSDLLGQRLGGAVQATVTGRLDTATTAFAATLSAQTSNLRAGPAPLDPVLAGQGSVTADISLTEAGRLRVDTLRVALPNLSVDGDVSATASETRADLAVRLRDIGLFTPDFSGPVQADIQATQDSAGWQVSGDATGPVGTAAEVAGRIGTDGTLALGISGNAPLALANVYIAPRQISGLATFDLSVNGPPQLSSVSGPITISDARLTAPNLRQAVEDIGGTITLAGGTARLDLGGTSAAGGSLSIAGPVDTAPPFQADLTITVDDVVLRDPSLYQTTANGQVSLSGPLAGGAGISGAIDLGESEVQIPSSGVGALGPLPDVTHLGAPSDVRQTLDRAGLLAAGDQAGDGPQTRPYPLDLVVRAPNRIFVRGRGLDAELGGQLRLGGTTNDVLASGRFDLIRGRLDILGQRFEFDEGSIQLQGDFIPFIRFVATTETANGTTVSIIIEGPADAPEVRFESAPELPQDEVLSQLLFGRDLSSISPLQAVELAAAIGTLAGRGGGGLLSGLRDGLKLDDLDITTDDEGNAAVRAGKYISENVYTDVTVASEGNTEVNINLDITDSFTARGSVASDGDTSVGIFFERDY